MDADDTYDIFDNTSRTGLLKEGLNVEQLRSVALNVGLWIFLRDTETLELSDDAHLHGFVLNDDVTGFGIFFG